MQLPFSKQLVAAALVAIVAPSATVIGAQSFSDFVRKPRPVIVAQEFGHPPGGSPGSFQPSPGGSTGNFQPPSGGEIPHQPPPPGSQMGSQSGAVPIGSTPPPTGMQPPVNGTSGEMKADICPKMPEFDCPSGMRRIVEQTPGGCPMSKCVPVSEPSERKEERREERREDRGGRVESPPGLEGCAKSALGEEAYERMRKGELQLSEEQKKLVQEQCQQFKRESQRPSPQPNNFPGRGEFQGRTPDGQFPGRGEGLENAPGAGGFGPGGPGEGTMGPGNFGPSDEEMERMEKERKAHMLQDMKRGLRGMEQGLRMMERGINACRKAKVDTTEPEAALTKIKEIIAKVKTAEDPEELMEVMQDLPELFDGAREHVEACHRLAELPRITKQLTREIKQLENEHRRLSAQAKRAKLDLQDQLDAIATSVTDLKTILAEVGQVKNVEAFDAAMEKLEGLRETFEDLHEKIEAVRSVLNVRRAISEARREIKNAERVSATYKRRKADTTELDRAIAEGKTLVAEIEALAKQRPIDTDALHEKFEQLEDLGQRAEEAIAKLRGQRIERAFEPKFSKSPVAGVELPDAFRQFERQEQPSAEGTPSELESLLGF